MKQAPFTLAGLLALCLAVPVAFSAEPPAPKPTGPLLGASDFLPTPQQPVGFRPNNAWYPGAGRPPLEFWDGTPGQVDVEVKGKKTKVWDCTDTKSKNILWKAPAPGWGLTHPIVVGKRGFAGFSFICIPPGSEVVYRTIVYVVMYLLAGKAIAEGA